MYLTNMQTLFVIDFHVKNQSHLISLCEFISHLLLILNYLVSLVTLQSLRGFIDSM